MKQRKANTRRLTQLALLLALVLIMSYTPLGYLPVGPLTPSLLTIPVAIGAMVLGPAAGAVLGGAFGLTSFFNALRGGSAMGSALFALNPLATFVMCFGARLAMGWLCGLVYRGARHIWPQRRRLCCAAGGLAAPLLNTVFFMGLLVLFFYRSDYVQGLVANMGAAGPLMFVIGMIGVQGVVEAVLGCAVGAAVTPPLLRVVGEKAPKTDR